MVPTRCSPSCRRNHPGRHRPGAAFALAPEGGGQLKTWLTMQKEDLARMSGPGVYGLRRWNREWLSLEITWTQDLQARAAAIRDVVVALDTGTTSPG